MYNEKDRHVRGVRANTRSLTKIKAIEERIRRAVAQYQAAWQALRVLAVDLGENEWEVSLKELMASDVRGIPRRHFGDPARQRGVNTTATEISDAPLDSSQAGSSGCGPGKRRRLGGGGTTGLSWIWIRQNESREPGDAEETDEALRIEWARTRARSLRWSEELDLLEEEMRRILQFLIWRADWWDERASLRENNTETAGDSTELREGLHAYSARQAALQRELSEAFKRDWQNLPAFIADARARSAELSADGEDAYSGLEDPEIDGEDPDAPVPLGPTGSVVLPDDDV
uniref:Uncharacterized protein n=1 Tax=Mycena chlorophos TaxID=658473 RepID=A0ABQ0LIR1_MYCCL|nr:predicted protein [Mycena chlorophos]